MLTTFTLDEIEKIYNKATKLYEDIKKIEINRVNYKQAIKNYEESLYE